MAKTNTAKTKEQKAKERKKKRIAKKRAKAEAKMRRKLARHLNNMMKIVKDLGVDNQFRAFVSGINGVRFTKSGNFSSIGLTEDIFKDIKTAVGDVRAWGAATKSKNELARDEERRKLRRNRASENLWEEYYEVHDDRGWRKNRKDYGSIVSSKVTSLEDGVQDYLEKKMIDMGNKLRTDSTNAHEINNLKDAIVDAKNGMSLEDLRRKYGHV